VAIPDELHQLGNYRIGQALDIAGAPDDAITGAVLLAIGSRESSMENIVGGGYFDKGGKWHTTGVDRGFFQLNIEAHHNFLASSVGCLSGSWTPVKGHTAAEVGYVPQFTTACQYVKWLRSTSLVFAKQNKVKAADRLMFSVCAHNLGDHGALAAYQHGGVDGLNAATMHGNYGVDVLARLETIDAWLKAHGG